MKIVLLLFFICLSIFAVYIATGEDEPDCYQLMLVNNPPWIDIVHGNHSEDLPDHWHDGEVDAGQHVHENVYRTYQCANGGEAAQWHAFYGEIHRPREEQNEQHSLERPSEIDTENDIDQIHNTGDDPDTGFVSLSDPPVTPPNLVSTEIIGIPEVELVALEAKAATSPEKGIKGQNIPVDPSGNPSPQHGPTRQPVVQDGAVVQDGTVPRDSETVPPNSVGRPKSKTPVSPFPISQDRLIFNEIRNASDDQNDWLEIKNISYTDISLKDWEISIITSDGDVANQDTDIVTLPEYTLPAGGILLIVNTDPNETSLLKGQNIEKPNVKTRAEHLYLVAEKLKLPSTSYLLILRSVTDKNGKPEAFEDIAGDHFPQSLGYNTQLWHPHGLFWSTWIAASLTEDKAWERVDIEKRGYAQEAWTSSGYQDGVGYKPSASVETSFGTPGYPNNIVIDKSLVGRITFSELMFATSGGRFSQPQWIELYNNTAIASEPLNLEGWKLEIEARDGEARHRYSVIELETLYIAPNLTVLLVTRDGRNNSGYLPDDRIYNLYDHHRDVSELGLHENAVLSAAGFTLKLFSPDGTLVDVAGNLDGRRDTKDAPIWELPLGRTEDDARTSLIRRYEDGVALMGTETTSWMRAADVQVVVNTYYGRETDIGTPGYRRGGPLPVKLSHFRAERMESGVILEWTTESETDNAGFNILRSQAKEGSFVKVNPTLILGAGTTAERSTYTWTDTTAKPNVAYYYRIEDISSSGDRQQLATVRMKGHVSAAGKFSTTWGGLKKEN